MVIAYEFVFSAEGIQLTIGGLTEEDLQNVKEDVISVIASTLEISLDMVHPIDSSKAPGERLIVKLQILSDINISANLEELEAALVLHIPELKSVKVSTSKLSAFCTRKS